MQFSGLCLRRRCAFRGCRRRHLGLPDHFLLCLSECSHDSILQHASRGCSILRCATGSVTFFDSMHPICLYLGSGSFFLTRPLTTRRKSSKLQVQKALICSPFRTSSKTCSLSHSASSRPHSSSPSLITAIPGLCIASWSFAIQSCAVRTRNSR